MGLIIDSKKNQLISLSNLHTATLLTLSENVFDCIGKWRTLSLMSYHGLSFWFNVAWNQCLVFLPKIWIMEERETLLNMKSLMSLSKGWKRIFCCKFWLLSNIKVNGEAIKCHISLKQFCSDNLCSWYSLNSFTYCTSFWTVFQEP